MRARAMILLGIFLGMGLLNGCASVVNFQVPAEFQDKKVKEDPPGTMLPEPKDGMKLC